MAPGPLSCQGRCLSLPIMPRVVKWVKSSWRKLRASVAIVPESALGGGHSPTSGPPLPGCSVGWANGPRGSPGVEGALAQRQWCRKRESMRQATGAEANPAFISRQLLDGRQELGFQNRRVRIGPRGPDIFEHCRVPGEGQQGRGHLWQGEKPQPCSGPTGQSAHLHADCLVSEPGPHCPGAASRQ